MPERADIATESNGKTYVALGGRYYPATRECDSIVVAIDAGSTYPPWKAGLIFRVSASVSMRKSPDISSETMAVTEAAKESANG